jgi:hypothetical protein
MKNQGYIQRQVDHIFAKFSSDGKFVALIVYVDDIVLTEDDIVEMRRVKERLAADFQIKDLGSSRYFLGMDVGCSIEERNCVIAEIHSQSFARNENEWLSTSLHTPPWILNTKLWGEGNVPVDTERYKRLVGKLILPVSH